MAKVPPSSGTLLSEGLRALCGLRVLSIEALRDDRVGLVADAEAFTRSFLRCF